MESTSEAMKIHISQSTKAMLNPKNYKIVERGKIDVKGKGEMKTYFVLTKRDQDGKSVKMSFMEVLEEYQKQHGKPLESEAHGSGGKHDEIHFEVLGEEKNSKNTHGDHHHHHHQSNKKNSITEATHVQLDSKDNTTMEKSTTHENKTNHLSNEESSQKPPSYNNQMTLNDLNEQQEDSGRSSRGKQASKKMMNSVTCELL
jgi:hypothetical protein